MTFPRLSSLVLAVGSSVWAFLLLWHTFGFLHYSAGFVLVWMLIWLPGFFAWYGYIRRAFGHFLFRRALATWLVSVVANGWSLVVLWSYSGGPASRELPVMFYVAYGWVLVALILSVALMFQERRLREPTPSTTKHAGGEELRKLLDEHRQQNG